MAVAELKYKPCYFAWNFRHRLCAPRQCSIYRGAARRASQHATLQPTPLEIVYPCGSSATPVQMRATQLVESSLVERVRCAILCGVGGSAESVEIEGYLRRLGLRFVNL